MCFKDKTLAVVNDVRYSTNLASALPVGYSRQTSGYSQYTVSIYEHLCQLPVLRVQSGACKTLRAMWQGQLD